MQDSSSKRRCWSSRFDMALHRFCFGGSLNAKFFGQLLELCCQSNKSPNSYKRRQVLGMIGAIEIHRCDAQRNGIESFINHGLHCYCLSALKPLGLIERGICPKARLEENKHFSATSLMSIEISSGAKSELFGWGFPGFCCEVTWKAFDKCLLLLS